MVMAQALVALLHAERPGCEVDVVAPAWTLPLLVRMPGVREALPLTIGHGELKLRERYRLGCELRDRHYQQAIVLPNSFKSALIPFFARIPRRTGFRGEMRYGLLNDLRRPDPARYPLMVDRFAALAFPRDAALPKNLPRPVLAMSPAAREAIIHKHHLAPDAKPVLILCPGAEFGPSKQWIAAHFAEVACAKLAAGWQVWLLGSKSDRAVAEHIDGLTGNACTNLAGLTTLGEATDLISLAEGVVTNDSGLMHVAAALSRPLIAVFGSTSPGFTPPLSVKATVIQKKLPCQPCFKRICPLGHHRCMQDLMPAEVLQAMSGWGS